MSAGSGSCSQPRTGPAGASPGSASAVSSWTRRRGRAVARRQVVRQPAAPQQRLDDRAADRDPLGLDAGGHAVVVQPGGHLHHRRRDPVEQRRDRRPRRRPAVGVQLPASARPPRGVEHRGVAPGDPPVGGRGDQVDDVGVPHLDAGQPERRGVQPRSAPGRPGRGRRRPRGRRPGRARSCRCPPRSRGRRPTSAPAGQQPRGAPVGERRPAGLLEGVAGEEQPVGVGAERRPRLVPLPRDAPRRPGQLGAHLGAQPGQRGHRVGARRPAAPRPGTAPSRPPASPAPAAGAPSRRPAPRVPVHRHSVAYGLVGPPSPTPGTRLSGWHSRG